MQSRSLSRTASLAGWVRGSRLPLRLVFLLSGSALALSLGTLDLVIADLLWNDSPVVVSRLVVAAVVLAPPTLLGLVPQLREVEGVAATSLLNVDFGGHEPGPTRTWDQAWRTAAWFWGHLLAGVFSGFVVVVGVIASVDLIAAPFNRSVGSHVLGISWLAVADTWRDLALAALGVIVVLVGALLLLLCSEGLVRIAPMLLGPSVPELLAELDSRTAHLVERTRLARELHDSVGHALSVVILQSAAARQRLATASHEAEGCLHVVEDVARKALEDLDGVLGLLREDQGAPLRQPVHDLGSLDGLLRAAREGDHEITVQIDPDDLAAIPGVVSREAYRIVQEGVTNAMRHAPDQPVHIAMARLADELRIELTNPVVPVRARAGAGGGRGLEGVRERVQMFGGHLSVGSRDGLWRLEVALPLPRQERS